MEKKMVQPQEHCANERQGSCRGFKAVRREQEQEQAHLANVDADHQAMEKVRATKGWGHLVGWPNNTPVPLWEWIDETVPVREEGQKDPDPSRAILKEKGGTGD